MPEHQFQEEHCTTCGGLRRGRHRWKYSEKKGGWQLAVVCSGCEKFRRWMSVKGVENLPEPPPEKPQLKMFE